MVKCMPKVPHQNAEIDQRCICSICRMKAVDEIAHVAKSASSDKYFKHAVALSSLDYDRLFKCNFPNIMTIDLENLENDTPSVEKWLNVCHAQPTTGRNLQNPSLAEALQHKIEFTQQEWDAFRRQRPTHRPYHQVRQLILSTSCHTIVDRRRKRRRIY